MKSFLNYSKNMFSYSLLKFLIVALLFCLFCLYLDTMQVYALDFSTYSQATKVTGNLSDSSGFESVTYNCSTFSSDGRCFGTINSTWSKWYSDMTYTIYFDTQLEANKKYQLDLVVYGTPDVKVIPFESREISVWWDTTNWQKQNSVKYVSAISAMGDGYYKLSFLFSIDSKTVKAFSVYSSGSQQFFSNSDQVAFTRYYRLTQATDNSDIIISQDKIYGAQQETNNKLDNIENSITDSTPPNLSGLDNSAGWLQPGPIDSILNLPLSLLTNLNNNLSGTCTPKTLTLPYVDKTLTLPCMDSVYEKIGISAWVNTVGVIASAFILYYYLLNLYVWVDNVLTFRENNWNDQDQWGGI